jgi:hypothetical protein
MPARGPKSLNSKGSRLTPVRGLRIGTYTCTRPETLMGSRVLHFYDARILGLTPACGLSNLDAEGSGLTPL